MFVLVRCNIKGATAYFAQQYVSITDYQFAIGKAHGGTTVAATAGLVKHQFSVLTLEMVN